MESSPGTATTFDTVLGLDLAPMRLDTGPGIQRRERAAPLSTLHPRIKSADMLGGRRLRGYGDQTRLSDDFACETNRSFFCLETKERASHAK